MCVVTKLNFFEGQLSQSVHPDPFRNECLNMIEWLMVSMIPFLVIGFVSLVFLLRKVSATTSYGGHSTPGYELVRGKMIIWHNSFSCGHFWGLIRHLVVYFLLMTRLISIGKSTSGLTSGSKNISVLRHSIGVNFVKHKLKSSAKLWTPGFLPLMAWLHFKKRKIHSRLPSRKR